MRTTLFPGPHGACEVEGDHFHGAVRPPMWSWINAPACTAFYVVLGALYSLAFLSHHAIIGLGKAAASLSQFADPKGE